jgi:protein-S-isoprenylcysteine O-methyltransferase Ste14
MAFYTNPFFWALISMFGLVAAASLGSGHRLGRNAAFVIFAIALVTVGRIVLVLPFCPQPRFDVSAWHWVIGGAIFVVGLAFGVATFYVRWHSLPEKGMPLRTTGFYGIVRHPIYLCEVLWFLGWAIMFGSVYGLALAPVWWVAFLFHTLSEEVGLERELGGEYLEYKKKVRGRIFPGLPF